MNRDIKTINHLPPFVREYSEIIKITEVEDVELNKLNKDINKLRDNQFFLYCDEKGVEYFENMLGIQPKKSETLEERKSNVFTIWNIEVPYTYSYLVNMLDNICGNDGYILELINNEYLLKVGLTLRERNKTEVLIKMFDRVLPCNIVYTIYIDFNKYGDFRKMTHGEMRKYTHLELREKIIE